MKKILLFCIGVFLLVACDNRGFDETDIIRSFPFRFEAKTNAEFFNNSISPIELKIDNEYELEKQNYTISFEIEGDGEEMFVEGAEIKGSFQMRKEKKTVQFKPLKTGHYTVKITASNGDEKYNVTESLEIDVKDRPFTPIVEGESVIFQSEEDQIELFVKVNTPDWVTYSWSWDSSQKNRIVYQKDSVSIPKKQVEKIDPNQTVKLVFSPQEIIGEHILFFSFTDTQGQKVQIDKKISVKSIDFDLKLEPTRKDIDFFEKGYLEFSLKPEFKSSKNPTEYTVYYLAEGTEGILNIDGTELKNRDKVTLKAPFDRKLISFTPTNYNGSATIKLVVEDKFGYQKEVTTNVNVKLIRYEVISNKITTQPLEMISKDRAKFTLDLRTTADIDKMKYTARIVSASDDKGYFLIDGKKIEYNQDFLMKKGVEEIIYIPESVGSGKHKIEFQVSDLAGQNPANSVRTLEFEVVYVKSVDYEIVSNQITTDFIEVDRKRSGKFSLDLRTKGDVEKLKYQVRVNSSDRGYLMMKGRRYDLEQDLPLEKGINEIEYFPTEYGSGKHRIEFQAVDLANQNPKSSIRPLEFKIYKPITIKNVEVGRTWVKHGHGSLKHPTYTMKYYLDYEVEGTGKVKMVSLTGWNKRNNEAFEFSLSDSEVKKLVKRELLEALNDVKGPRDIFEPGDEVEFMVGDERGYIKTLKIKVKDYN